MLKLTPPFQLKNLRTLLLLSFAVITLLTSSYAYAQYGTTNGSTTKSNTTRTSENLAINGSLNVTVQQNGSGKLKEGVAMKENATITMKSSLSSPKKQMESGIQAINIKCASGFQLVLKADNSSPACVKPATAAELVKRGWAMSGDMMVKMTNGQNMTK